jgi:hypothetical protein
MPVHAASKQSAYQSIIKLICSIFISLKGLNDSDSPEEAVRFVRDSIRLGRGFADKATFHDQLQAKLSGKWGRANDAINHHPDVSAARAIADAQQALYLVDLAVDSADVAAQVPPGNYDAPNDANGVTMSYFKLYCKELTRDSEKPWILTHKKVFQNSNFTQGKLSIVQFADEKFRKINDSWQTTTLTAIPNWLKANYFVCGLNDDLLTELLHLRSAELMADNYLTWSYESVYTWALAIESSPKYQADRKLHVKLTKLTVNSVSSTSSPKGGQRKDTRSSKPTDSSYKGPDGWVLDMTTNAYRAQAAKSWDAMTKDAQLKHSAKVADIRKNGPKVPAHDG